MSRVDEAVSLFEQGFSCSQAMLISYGIPLGLTREQACRLGASLSGGLRLGETCGAVAGAILVLGLCFGHTDPGDKKGKERLDQRVVEFQKRFAQQHSSNLCRSLLGFDLSRPGELEKARASGAFKTTCPHYVRSAAELLESMVPELRE